METFRNELLSIAQPLAPTQADFLETLALVLAISVDHDEVSRSCAVEMMERAKHLCDQEFIARYRG